VTIPNGVTSIGDYAFHSCTALTAIDVNAANANYASVDGVLYDKTITTLIQYPGGRAGAFTIPTSITTIGYDAFWYCTSLTSVTIPNSVTTIGEYAFQECTALTSITIPDSVTSIEYWAFGQCTSLKSITFLGLVAPTTVGSHWILDTDAEIRGYAYAASNFPGPGGVWNGLTMGAVIPVVPGAPTNLSATPGNVQVVLTWTAPSSDGGSVITGYKLYRSTTSGGSYALIASPSELTYTDAGLSNGQTYWYEVSAVNVIGEGAQAGPISSTPATVPTAPENLTAVGSVGSVALIWQAPASTGGSPLTGYKVFHGTTAHPSSTFVAVWPANTSATISGLQTGTVYYFNVVAVNIEGNSSASPDTVILMPSPGHSVPSVSSTSTVSDFAFNASKNELTFTVSGAPGTTGKTRVFVPSGLVGDPAKMTVKIDGNTVHHELTPVDGGWALDVTYQHSSHSLVIDFGALPDGQLDSILLIAVSVVAVVIVGGVSLLVFRPKKKKG